MVASAKPRLELFLRLCSEMALRFMEAYRVTPGNWDRERHTLKILTKGGKTRTIPTPETIERLLAIAAEKQPTESAISTLAGMQLQPDSLRKQFRKLVETCHVNPKLTPHDLRRTTATALYTLSKDLRAVQQVLGHSDLTSTLHYIAPLTPENLSTLLRELYRPRGEKEPVQ